MGEQRAVMGYAGSLPSAYCCFIVWALVVVERGLVYGRRMSVAIHEGHDIGGHRGPRKRGDDGPGIIIQGVSWDVNRRLHNPHKGYARI